MAKIDIVQVADVAATDGYGAHGHAVTGGARAREVAPAGFSLWMMRAELADGATVGWPEVHGDEAVYVVEGALEIDGRIVPRRGAAIVEADVVTTARAVGPTEVVHMGPVDPAQPTDGVNGPPYPEEHGVHVVGPLGTYANTNGGTDSHYYADSTCETCRLTLLSVGRACEYESEPHRHTQDELIHLISGGINLGRRHLGPGDTLAIGADVRYGFRGDPDGFVFVNYRRDASFQYWPTDAPRRLEGGAANAMTPVMDLI